MDTVDYHIFVNLNKFIEYSKFVLISVSILIK